MAHISGAGPSACPAPPSSSTSSPSPSPSPSPSSSSSSTTLIRKRAAAELSLMPPPPPVKRIKRPKTVIDEDSYASALSYIIARDFFPGLLESETQQEYLDALESKDETWIASAGRRLQHVMTPGRRGRAAAGRENRGRRGTGLGVTMRPVAETPTAAGQTPRTYVGDTPVSVSGASSVATSDAGGEEEQRKPDVDTAMSLGAFQAKYTSEDNESFYKLLDRQNSKKAEKYAWMWSGNNKLPSKMQLKQREVENRLLESRGSLADDVFLKRDRLAIRDAQDNQRPAQCDTWNARPDNALMFAPDGLDTDVALTASQVAAEESRAPPKAISYRNTRMPQPDVIDDSSGDRGSVRSSSPSVSAVRAAIAGKRTEPHGSTSTTAGGETPRVNGYAFVDDEEPEHDQRLLPKIDLGPGDDTPNPFMIKAQPRREALHYRMVDRISQSKRSSSTAGMTGKVDKTPVPKFPSSPRVGAGSSFTPAAQRLWSKIGNKSGQTPRTPFGDMTTPVKKGSKLRNTTK